MPSANTLVRWVNENAFAFILQARPCPTFGRPVHLRGSPHRLQPDTSPHALRIPPHDGHPALRVLRSSGSRSALVCFRLSPSCPFRHLHTFHSSRPARHYPRFWIRRSSFERRRDLNPPDQRAAQRTVRPPPTPCSASLLRFRVPPLYASLPDEVASAGPNRVSPVVSMRCLCVLPPCTPSRRSRFTLEACWTVGRLRLQGTGSPREELQLNWRNRPQGYTDDRTFKWPLHGARATTRSSPNQIMAELWRDFMTHAGFKASSRSAHWKQFRCSFKEDQKRRLGRRP